MARIIKVKKEKRGINKFALVFFAFALVASLGSDLFIRNINNSLTMKLENINRESVELKQMKSSLELEIQGLKSKERVYVVAKEAGLVRHGNNVKNVVVRGE